MMMIIIFDKAICDSPHFSHQEAVRQSLYVHRQTCDWQ